MARLIATLALALVLSPLTASAQLAPADAGAFIGTWVLNLDTPQGSMDQNVVLKDEGGKVVAEMSSQMAPETQKVTVSFDINSGQFSMSGTGVKK